jgi:hypothetical protein
VQVTINRQSPFFHRGAIFLLGSPQNSLAQILNKTLCGGYGTILILGHNFRPISCTGQYGIVE